jgi:hypothetical protein
MVWGEGAIRREADIATADNEIGMNATTYVCALCPSWDNHK